MNKFLLFILVLFLTTSFTFAQVSFSNVIINEIDADNVGVDALEFIELFDGGAGNTSLTGSVIVFFNGSTDLSYRAIDLDGFSTNAAGYFVLGNAAVPNVDFVFANNVLQNGADAVGFYAGDAANFPNGTPVTLVNLIDAVVYDTDDADDASLLILLNGCEPQLNENNDGFKDVESLQRLPNGTGGARNTSTYITAVPTPGTQNSNQSEIEITGNAIVILDGDITPNLTDNTDFGATDVPAGTITKTFVIKNLGTDNLYLTGNPLVNINGADAGDFNVTVLPASPIAPITQTTFDVQFDPSAIGVRKAEISIESVDWDENPYNFSIEGTGLGNNPPLLNNLERKKIIYTEGDGAVSLTSTLIVTDDDNAYLQSATVEILQNYSAGEDELLFTDISGITGSWNSNNGVLTLTGSAKKLYYKNALHSVQYINNSLDPSTLERTISLTVNDGDANSNTLTRKIEVISINTPPEITGLPEYIELLCGESCVIDICGCVSDAETENDLLSYNFNIDNDCIATDFDLATGQLILTAGVDYIGEVNLTVIITDEEGLFVERETIIHVEPQPLGIEAADGIPTEYQLAQNYPNPFNPSTIIEYGLPEEKHITLIIYNLLGQEIVQLINKVESAGYHNVIFDASHLKSGIYFYKIQAGSFVQIKKMILIK